MKIFQFPKQLKFLIASLLLSLTFGVIIGLGFLYYTTSYSTTKAIERYNGSQITNEFEIAENYPKPISEIFITTHNHIIAFTLIFTVVGFIFYFSSIPNNRLKNFLLIEPFISIIISFGSLWLIRFVNENFVYLMAVSSSFIYLSYFTMVSLILYEIFFKKL
ncbi:MAG: hypothetical protein N3D80_01410 [Ignavibacterium album]|jgi:hypothetical protein|uniref:hypothetical protein n=1 Tax=Ignavibacterium album TaxID=591197 RepID=UPI0026ECA4B9|nr:hypothetical protein [Ignavibacterium album]MCX8104514.1 hypothetical protein [Ignavibacterium album]